MTERTASLAALIPILAAGLLATSPTPAPAAPKRTVCHGTLKSPGVLAGHLRGEVKIAGVCAVNSGPAVVSGVLRISPGSTLLADYALNRRGSGNSSLTVRGSVYVAKKGVLELGCDATYFPCADEPDREAATLNSHGRIYGNLIGNQPLGVVVHASSIGGYVSQSGGGGGKACNLTGIFLEQKVPIYSDYEDTTIGHSLIITGIRSCWLGVIRLHVGRDVRLLSNQLNDPDAIEVLANDIGGDLICSGNSSLWDSTDFEGPLFPRRQEPNMVSGRRTGQCVLESRTSEGGASGPGSF